VAHPAELVEQHGGVGGAQRGVAGSGARDQRVDVRRERGHQPRRRRDVLVHVLVGDLDRRVGLVRLLAGEHLVDQHAGRVDVGAGVGMAVDDELGGEVGDGADQHAGARVLGLGVDGASQPEVGDLDPAVVGQQDVLGLHVAVDHPGPVGGAQRGQHRLDHGQRPGRRHRCLGADQVAERDPGDVLHDQEQGAVVVALVEHRDHVVVGEPGGRLRLAPEATGELVVVAQSGVHHLDRDRAVEPGVGGLVDSGHAAPGDPRSDQVAAVEEPADERVGDPVGCHALHVSTSTSGGEETGCRTKSSWGGEQSTVGA
jgi:hypothetical protein